ncbi:hypothetical protein B0T24DRAFT_159959 [Lasiosphaeria ovina]|uniref:PHD and RING finger domain-containing protein n=1 Tax=Lasiosphaeria ovina TaxID=92902 RepID=A0AAE0KNM5_9PEZI|nr:hypothetical protein B0T24DRAFT_159959 [Lasiosphaeria ovina]
MADQCIVCLENLEVEPPTAAPPEGGVAHSSAAAALVVQEHEHDQPAVEPGAAANGLAILNGTTTPQPKSEDHENVAEIQVCGHVLHDSCLQEWTGKANSCPICRQTFHMVHVYDRIGGAHLLTRRVEDKKQVAEYDPQAFDPGAWLVDAEEQEPSNPCPICNLADNEDVLLLCDSCDASYHTYCIGLDRVPAGGWYCMECAHERALVQAEAGRPFEPVARRAGVGPRHRVSRTQASMRRARQRARSDEWQGAWGRIAGRVWDAISIDLDFQDENDDGIISEGLRRTQHIREQEREELLRWQQRMNIASRMGARDFASHIPNVFHHERPPTPQETREEQIAWGALEKAIDGSARKRKSRSATPELNEPQHEPERKLKRPRTRRLPPQQNGESSSSAAKGPPASNQVETESSTPTSNAGPSQVEAAPSFLTSLLKEVEMSTAPNEDGIRALYEPIPRERDHDVASPGRSPSPSGYSSPRAMSLTPPPNYTSSPGSPQMTLSSYIAPVYPPVNFSPTRSSSPAKQSRSSSPHRHAAQRDGRSSPEKGELELRQPRPQRAQIADLSRSQDISPAENSPAAATPAATTLPLEMKKEISRIVRNALKPHWRSAQLTAEQYASINRDISRKIYEEVKDPATVGEDANQTWEAMATKEVTRAVAKLKA